MWQLTKGQTCGNQQRGKHVLINKWANMCQSTKVQTCADQQRGKNVPINKGANMCQTTKGQHVPINKGANMCQSTNGQTYANQRRGQTCANQVCHSTDWKTRSINRWAKSYILQMAKTCGSTDGPRRSYQQKGGKDTSQQTGKIVINYY
jgi:hypothetical protein